MKVVDIWDTSNRTNLADKLHVSGGAVGTISDTTVSCFAPTGNRKMATQTTHCGPGGKHQPRRPITNHLTSEYNAGQPTVRFDSVRTYFMDARIPADFVVSGESHVGPMVHFYTVGPGAMVPHCCPCPSKHVISGWSNGSARLPPWRSALPATGNSKSL